MFSAANQKLSKNKKKKMKKKLKKQKLLLQKQEEQLEELDKERVRCFSQIILYQFYYCCIFLF